MATKRGAVELDPDYEDVTEQQNKRQKVLEQDAKEATVRRIENILRAEFSQEIQNRETAIDIIDQRLHTAQKTLDKLRACIVATYYGNAGRVPQAKNSSNECPSIHPTIKKHIGKTVKNIIPSSSCGSDNLPITDSGTENKPVKVEVKPKPTVADAKRPVSNTQTTNNTSSPDDSNRSSRFKIKKRVVVGNVSKYIPVDRREENDQSTHKWMVYVRGSAEEPQIDHFVKKVWFFLHPSYRPNDLVEVSQPPFHLTRRGWGEFPIRIQLHFIDSRNKRVDILHQLKLDRTYTGLQTLGAETIVDVELEREGFGHNLKPSITKQELYKQLTGVNSDEQKKVSNTDKCTDDSESLRSTNVLSLHQIINSRVVPKPHSTDSSSSSTADSGISDMSSCDSLSSGVTIKHESPVKQTSTRSSVSSSASSLLGCLQRTPISSPVTSPKSQTSSRSNPSPKTQSPGWTRVQIKSEPLSPRSRPTTPTSGNTVCDLKFQNITQMIKQEDTFQTSSVRGGRNGTLSQAKPVTVTSPSVSKSTVQITFAKSNNVIENNQPNMSSALGAMLQQPVTKPCLVSPSGGLSSIAGVQKTPQVIFKTEALVNKNKKITPVSNINSADKVIIPSGEAGTTGSSSTVYVKCMDSQGKVYLIPQHLLVKAPTGSSTGGGSGGNPAIPHHQGNSLLNQNNTAVSSHSQATPSVQYVIGKDINTNQPVLLEQTIKSPGGTTVLTGSNSQRVLAPVRSPSRSKGTVLRVTSPSTVTAANSSVKQLPQSSAHTTLLISPSSKGKTPSLSLIRGTAPANKPAITTLASAQLQQPLLTSNSGKPLPLLQNVISPPRGVAPSQPQLSSSSLFGSNLVRGVGTVKNTGGVNKVPVPTVTYRPTGGISLLANSTLPAPVRTPAAVSETGPSAAPLSIITQNVPVSKTSGTGSSLASLLIPITSPMLNAQVRSAGNSTVAPSPVIIRHEKPQPKLTNVVSQSPPMATNQSLVTTNIGNQTFLLKLLPDQQSVQSTTNQIVLLPSTGVSGQPITSAPQGHVLPVHRLAEAASTKKISGKGHKISSQHKQCHESTEKNKTDGMKSFSQEIRLEEINSLECLVKILVKQHPLVEENIERQLHPYCALSWKQFLGWNIGKRRAAEWQRACAVRKRILQLLKPDNQFKGEAVWSTGHIVVWCREHWYTPLGPELKRKLNRPPPSVNDQKFTTCTDTAALFSRLNIGGSASDTTATDDSDGEVDIISLSLPTVKQEKEETPVNCGDGSSLMVPHTPATEFVRDTLQEIGIKLQPVELTADVYSPVVEKMLLTTTLSFMDDILRHTVKELYRENRNPEELGVVDLYRGISTTPQCDFLTNSYLGMPEVPDIKGQSVIASTSETSSDT